MSERERFLSRLADEASRSLSEGEAAALVAEARDHLADDVQARLELGATLDEAEGEAIAAFGTPQAVSRPSEKGGRAFLGALALVCLCWCAPLLIPRMPGLTTLPPPMWYVAVHLIYLWASGRSRRCHLHWVAIVSCVVGALAFAARLFGTLSWAGKIGLGDVLDASFSAAYAAGFAFALYGLLHLLGWTFGGAMRRDRLRRS